MPRAPDRRSARSRRALRDALVTLLEHKPFDGITPRDLVAQSHLARSTFYAYCSGKEDLLRRSLQALRAELVAEHARRLAARESGTCPILAAELMFAHLARHRHLYPAVSRGRPAAIWQRELLLAAEELVQCDLAQVALPGTVPAELAARMLAGALLELLTWWLKTSPPRPVEQLLASYRSLASGLLG